MIKTILDIKYFILKNFDSSFYYIKIKLKNIYYILNSYII